MMGVYKEVNFFLVCSEDQGRLLKHDRREWSLKTDGFQQLQWGIHHVTGTRHRGDGYIALNFDSTPNSVSIGLNLTSVSGGEEKGVPTCFLGHSEKLYFSKGTRTQNSETEGGLFSSPLPHHLTQEHENTLIFLRTLCRKNFHFCPGPCGIST